MSYEKNTWRTGDVITAEKLNNIEEGIEEASQSGGGGSDIPSIDPDGYDNGCALMVDGTQMIWGFALPTYDAYDGNKALVISETYNRPVWKSVGGGSEIPPYSYGNIDQVLTVSYTSGGTSMLSWQSPFPYTQGKSGINALIYDGDNENIVWDSSALKSEWSNYEVPYYDYLDFEEGAFLTIGAGQSTTCPLEWRKVIPSYSYENDGATLTVATCDGSKVLEWKELLPDPSSLSQTDTILANTSDGWGPSWCIPTAGTGVVPGALLCVESTGNNLACNWGDIMNIINSAAGLPSDGDVLTFRDGSLAWEAPQISN